MKIANKDVMRGSLFCFEPFQYIYILTFLLQLFSKASLQG